MLMDNDFTVEPNDSLHIASSYGKDSAYLEQEQQDFQRALARCSVGQMVEPGTQFSIPGSPLNCWMPWDMALASSDEPLSNFPPDHRQGDSKDYCWRPTDSATPTLEVLRMEGGVDEGQNMPANEAEIQNDATLRTEASPTGLDPCSSDSNSSQENKDPGVSKKKRGKAVRSRTGCMACRQLKKKCDEDWQVRTDSCRSTATKCRVVAYFSPFGKEILC